MPLLERDQVGKREWLADLITRVDAKSKPLLAMVPKGEPIMNMLMEYQVDDFEEPADIAVEDGVDAESFDNASPNRALLQTYAMKVQDAAMVSDLAENVSEVAGLSKGELAESIMKKLEKVGRSLEAFIGGDQEHQAGAAGTPYKIRGLGQWISATAQATLPVNENYLTPTGSIYSGTIADLDNDDVNDLLESSWLETGKEMDFELIAGSKLRRRFSQLTRTQAGTTNTFSVIRTYNTNFARKIDDVVDQFQGDYGKINIHSSQFNAHASFGGSAAANLRRGYCVPMSLLSLHYKRKPRVRQLEDRGGGPRFLVDAICALRVKSPLPLIKFASTS